MRGILIKLRVLSWAMFAFGVLGSIAVLGCSYYFTNVPKNLYLIISVCLVAAFSLAQLFQTFFQTYKIEKIRHLSDLKASDIVGNDIGAAYDFGQLGLIVTDDKGTVLWLNNLLQDRGINIVDYNIKDLAPELYELIQDKHQTQTCQFRHDNKYYDAKFIKEANLFIVKDTTNYESLVAFNEQHKTVIGYLNLDNYGDMPSNDELQRTEIEGSIRKTVIDYFRRFDCLLKPIRTDFYMLILTKEDLQKVIDDKFSIISDIAKEFEPQGLTCSLGFGYGFPDYYHNNELASNSLDVALSRGGNQCVVAPFGENMLFYGGGNTESRSSTNKVRIKTFARSFITTLEHASNVIIVPHNMADMDAIGASLGVFSICMGLKKPVPANIIYDNQAVERAADAAVRSTLPTDYSTKVFVSFKDAINLKQKDTLIVVVDHNRPSISIYPDLYKGGTSNIAIIDHHRKQDDSFKNPLFEHIDSSASSTCELLAEYIDALSFKINVSNEVATIMLSGIYLDTENFKVKTGILTHEAAIILSRLGADETKARDFLKEDYESFVVKSKIISTVETVSYGILIAKADDDEIVDQSMLASVCDSLRDIESTRACFAIGRISETSTFISSRGNGKVNCELLMMKMGGGGHFSSAAALLKDTNVAGAYDLLKHILDQYLKDATNIEDEDEDEKGE